MFLNQNIYNFLLKKLTKQNKIQLFQKQLPYKFFECCFWKMWFSFQLTKHVFHFENRKFFCFFLFPLKTRKQKQKTKRVTKHGFKFAKTCMWVCNFQHVRREGNKLAHSLARRAVLATDTDVWLEELPLYLENVFQLDLPE